LLLVLADVVDQRAAVLMDHAADKLFGGSLSQQLMRLPGILNQCHPIPKFVSGQASFAEDGQAILSIRPPADG